MHTTGLVLDAFDTLFFRDGRPFGAGDRGRSGFPMPQTLAGALRTHALASTGFDFEALRTRAQGSGSVRDLLLESGAPAWAIDLSVRGPLPAILGRDGRAEPLYPAPANLFQREDGSLVRLDPLPESPAGFRGREGLLPIWHRGARPGEPARGYLRLRGAEAWLAGDVPDRCDLLAETDLYGFEERTGLSIAPDTGTGEDGRLYSVRLLRPRDDRSSALEGHRVAFYAEVVWDDAGPSPAMLFNGGPALPWGGEGRRVLATCCPRVASPRAPAIDGRTVSWLVTPAIFEGGWCPDARTGLVSAAVRGVFGVSGWDLARQAPKPNRFAVEAGSLYFYTGDASEALLADADLVSQGWAMTLSGGWNHA